MSNQVAKAPKETKAKRPKIRGNTSALKKVPKQVRAVVTLNLIGDSIREVLTEKSRDSFAMTDITDAAARRGVSLGSVYTYIDGKHPTKSARELALDFVWAERGDNQFGEPPKEKALQEEHPVASPS